MNCASLDSIGIAAFGHDFGALRGEHGTVEEAFDMFGSAPPRIIDVITILLGPTFPFLLNLPTQRRQVLRGLDKALQGVAESLLEGTRKEAELDVIGGSSRSIIGALSELDFRFNNNRLNNPQ